MAWRTYAAPPQAAVRVLLDAGADKNAQYESTTALQMDKKLLIDCDDAAEKRHYLDIAAMLGDASAGGIGPRDAADHEVEKFAANAQQPAYTRFRQTLTERSSDSRP